MPNKLPRFIVALIIFVIMGIFLILQANLKKSPPIDEQMSTEICSICHVEKVGEG